MSHDLGIGCRARRQDILTEGWFALFVVCVGSYSSSWGLWWKAFSIPHWRGLSPISFKPPMQWLSHSLGNVWGCRLEGSLSVLPETKLNPKKQEVGENPSLSSAVVQVGRSVCHSYPYTGCFCGHQVCTLQPCCAQLHPERVVDMIPLAIAPHHVPVAESPQHCLELSHQQMGQVFSVVWVHPAWLSLVPVLCPQYPKDLTAFPKRTSPLLQAVLHSSSTWRCCVSESQSGVSARLCFCSRPCVGDMPMTCRRRNKLPREKHSKCC